MLYAGRLPSFNGSRKNRTDIKKLVSGSTIEC